MTTKLAKALKDKLRVSLSKLRAKEIRITAAKVKNGSVTLVFSVSAGKEGDLFTFGEETVKEGESITLLNLYELMNVSFS